MGSDERAALERERRPPGSLLSDATDEAAELAALDADEELDEDELESLELESLELETLEDESVTVTLMTTDSDVDP